MSIPKVTFCYKILKGVKTTANLCEFGKEIKIRLIELNQTQKWLIDAVKDKTGMYFDSSYLHRIATGANHNPKIVEAIKEILDI